MEIEVPQDNLQRICAQLTTEHRPGRRDGIRTAHVDMVRDGWGMRHDLQDILWETDDRADMLARHNDDFDFLLSAFDLHWVSRYRRPPASAKEAWGGEAMRAEDIALWVMEIERLGFTVDAQPLVQALRPRILKQKHVTNSELAVMWYGRDRHHFEPTVLKSSLTPDRVETIITHSGYKATMLYQGEKLAVLRVDPPKSRKGFPLKYWVPAQLRLVGHRMP